MTSHIPKITSNLPTSAVQTAQKYAGTSHGYSIIALTLLDKENRGYTIDVTFDTMEELQSAADQMLGVWERCESNKVLFRSCKNNGVFVNTFNGNLMKQNDSVPSLSEEFNTHVQVIMDMCTDDTSITYKFYRCNEQRPRILKLKLA